MTERPAYYRDHEEPDTLERDAMWAAVARSLPGQGPRAFHLDRRSFLYGVAASIILMFSLIGVYTTVRSAIEGAQPEAVRIDRAYQSAIRAFEAVATKNTPDNGSERSPGLAATRKEQLALIDNAIDALRRETPPRDVSPLLQARLRDLYGKKLALLQTMVEQGDFEL